MPDRSRSQPVSGAEIDLLNAVTCARTATGTTWPALQVRSFIWMNSAARLTGSSSFSDKRNSLSYSGLDQRHLFCSCQPLAFWHASHDTHCCMKRSGSVPARVLRNISMSAKNLPYVSGLVRSDEKNTEACPVFSSSSMPALPHACLTMACTFWRTELIEVWKTSFRRLPSLARTPSPPRFQPAASSSALALSTLNSDAIALLLYGAGLLSALAVAVAARP